jgi:hypothetical protein
MTLPKRCKDCHAYETECRGTCAIPGPFIFKHGTAELLLDGPPPTEERAWLNGFARACVSGSISLEDVASGFCQLGISDPSKPDADMADTWFGSSETNGRAYNYAIWFVLKHTRGLEAMRKAIEEDMTKGDAEYGEIFLKSYGRDLLDNFLIEEPKWV